jgi:hypothetical protein
MKPFRETKLGKFLQSKGLENVLDVAGDFIPGVATLDTIKNLVFNSKKLSPEDHKEFMELLAAQQAELDAIITDRKDARNREIEMARLGKTDWVHKGLVVLIAVIWAGWNIACFMHPQVAQLPIIKEIQIRINDFMFILVTYHFSSTAGSKLKTQLMGKQPLP